MQLGTEVRKKKKVRIKYDRIGITSELAKDLTTTNHKNYEVEAQKGREKRVKFSQQIRITKAH